MRATTSGQPAGISATKTPGRKVGERVANSKKGSGQFRDDRLLNEYDLPDIETMAKAKLCRKGVKARKRAPSKESGSSIRDRTNSRTRQLMEDTCSDQSSELRTPNLDFFKLLTAKKDIPLETKKIKTAKKVSKKKRSKSKDANTSQPHKVLFKKPKKSVPTHVNSSDPKQSSPAPAKKKVSHLKNKLSQVQVSSSGKLRSQSNSKSRQPSLPRSSVKSRDTSLKSRKTSKKRNGEKKKDEYFVGVNKSLLKKKSNSIAVAKGTLL